MSYRVYVTEALRIITENTTHVATPKGVADYGISLKKSWLDIVDPAPEPEPDTRTTEEIVDGIWANMRKKKRKER